MRNTPSQNSAPSGSKPTKVDFDFRDLIQREFASRQGRNAKYSLRAFARDLDLPAPKLSQILKGTCGLSAERGESVAKRLGLTPGEKRLFICCLEANFSRNPAKRKKAQARLAIQAAQIALDLEQFKLVADWHHLALLETFKLSLPSQEPKVLAQVLNIDEARVNEALIRLEKLELIERSPEDGQWQATSPHVQTTADIPSRDIREHHRQVLSKASDALDKFSVEERDFSTLMMAFDENDIADAKAMLNEFKDRFELRFARQQNADRVYAVALQLFPLSQKSKTKRDESLTNKSNQEESP